MQLSDIPAWFAKRFGADATGTHIRSVPATSGDPNAASMSLGFPPNTFVDVGAGGAPPDGRDFNGILNYLSAWAQWSGLGGPAPWSSVISAAAGGYPLGAIVLSGTVTGRIYQSQVNNNTTNPDTGGAGWIIIVGQAASSGEMTAGTSLERVVTPGALVNAGYDRVVAQSLITNGGFRQYASGYKECWGITTLAQNTSGPVTFPITYTGAPHMSCSQTMRNSTTDQEYGGILNGTVTTTGCTILNGADFTATFYWSARGL